MQSKHEAFSSGVFIPCKTMMNYMQEEKEESGRSGLGSGYTSKAPVTVNPSMTKKAVPIVPVFRISSKVTTQKKDKFKFK